LNPELDPDSILFLDLAPLKQIILDPSRYRSGSTVLLGREQHFFKNLQTAEKIAVVEYADEQLQSNISLKSHRLGSRGLLKNISIADMQLWKSCVYAVDKVLPSSCRIAIISGVKLCHLPRFRSWSRLPNIFYGSCSGSGSGSGSYP
jgi:hypothetical protein